MTEPGPLRPRVPIVIRLSSDGFVEVFCKRRREVSVKIIQRLHLLNGTAADATSLDEYDKVRLPKWHRDLLEARYIITTDQCKTLTPDEEAARLQDREFLSLLKGAANQMREERNEDSPEAT